MQFNPLLVKCWKWGFYIEVLSFIGFGVDIDGGILIGFTLAGGEITINIGLQK